MAIKVLQILLSVQLYTRNRVLKFKIAKRCWVQRFLSTEELKSDTFKSYQGPGNYLCHIKDLY
ncbi:MAG: hypothetical protein ACQEQO_12165, partial [Thermodesulfobacteriota bacterium]